MRRISYSHARLPATTVAVRRLRPHHSFGAANNSLLTACASLRVFHSTGPSLSPSPSAGGDRSAAAGSAPTSSSSSDSQQHSKIEGESASAPAAEPSLFTVIREEFGKLFAFVAHDVSKTAAASADAAKAYKDKMTDANMSEEERERRRKKTEAYQHIMNKNAAKAKEANEAATAGMGWRERAAHAMQQMKQAASPQAGVAALVQHCAAAHQAEVAVEEGIDVEDIQVVLETVRSADGIGYETKVVGYIDAPKASEEQVYAYAERMKQRCPAANTMQHRMEWRKRPPAGSERVSSAGGGGSVPPIDYSAGASSDERTTAAGANWSARDGEEELRTHTASSSMYGGGGGASAASFPSSFGASRRYGGGSGAGGGSSKGVGKSGFDNPFEKLRVLREADEGTTSSPTPPPKDVSDAKK